MINVKAKDFAAVKLKLEDLINDAVERNDTEALAWLREESMKQVTRKVKKDGVETEQMIANPITAYRVEYLKKYCGFEKKSSRHNSEKAKAAARAKKIMLFEAAFDKLNK